MTRAKNDLWQVADPLAEEDYTLSRIPSGFHEASSGEGQDFEVHVMKHVGYVSARTDIEPRLEIVTRL